jgi:hypothetical protein
MQQQLHDLVSTLRYMYIACLVDCQTWRYMHINRRLQTFNFVMILQIFLLSYSNGIRLSPLMLRLQVVLLYLYSWQQKSVH